MSRYVHLVPNKARKAADWDAKYVNDLPDSSFAFIEPGGEKDKDGKTEPRSKRHLPYRDANGSVDLNHTRNALARIDQVSAMPDGKKETVKKMLQSILEKGRKEASDSLKTDKNGVPTEIEIMHVGEWKNTPYHGSFEITAEDLKKYKANFDNGIRKGVPIDIDHESAEAAGWIKEVFIKGDSLFGIPEWTEKGYQLVQSKAYRFISPEFWPEGYQDPETGEQADAVLTHVSLVNAPLFKGLAPLTASDSLTRRGGVTTMLAEKASDHMDLEQLLAKNAADLTDEEQKFLRENEAKLSDDDKEKFKDVLKAESDDDSDDSDSDKDDDKDTDADADKDGDDSDDDDDSDGDDSDKDDSDDDADKDGDGDADADTDDDSDDADGKQAGDKSVKVKASTLKRLKRQANEGSIAHKKLLRKEASDKARGMLFGDGGKGKFAPGAHKELTSFLLSLTEDQTKAFDKLVKQIPEAKLAGEIGDGGRVSSSQKEFDKAVDKAMEADDSLDYASAMKKVAKEKPELAKSLADDEEGS